jgi:hypothetical protein
MKYDLRISVKDYCRSRDLKIHGMHARTGLTSCARSRRGGPCRVHLLVQKKSDPLPGRISQPGGCFLAVVVLQFTARCSQGSSIEKRSQLGKTLELNSAGGIGCRLGAPLSQSAKDKRLRLLNRSQPNPGNQPQASRLWEPAAELSSGDAYSGNLLIQSDDLDTLKPGCRNASSLSRMRQPEV